MKILHLGDLHIGRSLGEFDLIDDQRYILDRLLDMAEDKNIDVLLIAGDIYDRAVPSEHAVRLFNYFLENMIKKNIKIVAISGNHDSDERLNFGSGIFSSRGLYICAKYEGFLKKINLKDDFGDVNIYPMPFIKASQVRYFMDKQGEDGGGIKTYNDAVKHVLDSADVDKSKRNILLAHQFVTGFEDPKLAGSESMTVKSVGTVEKIDVSLFDDFDYVALGHIHSPQKVVRETVRYSGSPYKYSLSEVNNEKSVPIIDIKEKGNIEIELVPIKPLRNMRHLKGKLSDIIDEKNIVDNDDYIYVTLTDEVPVNDAMAILQQRYPHTIKLDYDRKNTNTGFETDIDKKFEEIKFDNIIKDFYKYIYNEDMTDEEFKIMSDIAKEAGV